jgi:hypothetical protein
MKTCFQSSLLALSILVTGLASIPANAYEVWKGKTEVSPIEVGLMTGTSFYGSSANWAVLASGSYLFKAEGFLDDIDDRIWLEGGAGPTFFSFQGSAHTGLQYTATMRWDFTYNEYWTFYGLGGLGGFILPDVLGGGFAIHPRFGGGAEYQTKTALLFRGEVSSDFLGVGVALNF